MSSKVIELKEETFAEVVDAPGLALVDFWAVWCGPCKMIAPVVQQMAEEYDGRVRVAKLNVDDAPTVAARYNIRSIPTIILFRDGQVIDTIVGAVPRAQIVAAIEKALA